MGFSERPLPESKLRGWKPIQWHRRESGMAGPRQQSQERALKEMTRQHTDCNLSYVNAKNSLKIVSSS